MTRAACLRCSTDSANPFMPCSSCLEAGVSANARAVDPPPVRLDGAPFTPLRPLATHPHTFLKDERGGMTWSYKDRLAAAAAAHATDVGATTIILSSSGNHGAAVAAAASAVGLRCVVVTMTSIAPAMRRLVEGCGGELVPLRTAKGRWTLVREAVATLGWYPASNFHDPPIGSNPFAVAGYRQIAYEIVEQMGVPDWVVVPVGYGDGLSGIAHGFTELGEQQGHAMPRLVAAVTSPSLPEAFASGEDQPRELDCVAPSALSIACPQSTYQAVHALRASGGAPVLIDERQALAARREMGMREGVFLELSSAVAFAAVVEGRRTGLLGENESVVIIGTSPGVKDQPLPGDGDALSSIDGELDEMLAYLGLEPVSTAR